MDRMNVDLVTRETLTENTDMLIERMDEYNVEKTVLTPIEHRVPSELYLEAANMYPDRLAFACSVMPRPIDEARARIDHFADQGCKAYIFDEEIYHPADPAAHAVAQMAVEKDLAVYFHHKEISSEVISFLDRLSLTYPSAQFVVLHMGGLFGFSKLIPLIARNNVWLEVSVTLPRLVESPLRVFLDALIQDLGVRKLVFGSEHHSEYQDLMASLNLINLNVETMRVITERNARHILNL
jgi:predicted TIM-barrel fold metal-dependent hydrolase